jgi:predicted short-subunit dehydrogenase-like oxidoreductase (DUF2520 family)
MTTLNIIGCGAVGKTLGRLFHQAGTFQIQDILNRTTSSAAEAAAFIGAGRTISGYAEMQPADLYLIAASDDSIAAAALALAASGLVRCGDIVWQASGALPSQVLAPLREQGAEIASMHPVKSFADPAASVESFAGTWCGVEGDPSAVAVLSAAATSIGARVFSVDPAFKSVYHAGAVLSCNYLTALLEVGVRAYEKGGLSRETALQVMEPLVRGTLDNVFHAGTAKALTGPIARGDAAVVAAQLSALEQWDGHIAGIYRALGLVAAELSRQKGAASPEALAAIEELLAGGK